MPKQMKQLKKKNVPYQYALTYYGSLIKVRPHKTEPDLYEMSSKDTVLKAYLLPFTKTQVGKKRYRALERDVELLRYSLRDLTREIERIEKNYAKFNAMERKAPVKAKFIP